MKKNIFLLTFIFIYCINIGMTKANFVHSNNHLLVDVQLIMGDICGDENANISVPVIVQNFNSIAGAQFSMHIPTAIATITGVGNFHPNMSLSQDDFNLNNTANGTITMGWFHNADINNGVTVNDNEALFYIDITLTAPAGTTAQATIDDNPIDVEIVDAGSPFPILPVNYNHPGTICVNSGPDVDVQLIMGDICGDENANISVPVIVQNFNSIAGAQFSMHIPTSIATITGVGNFHPNMSLSQDDFNLNNTANGTITMGWFHNADINNGVTVNDNEALFYIDITLTAPAGTTAQATIDDNPIDVEIVDAGSPFPILPVNYNHPGTICVNSGPTEMVELIMGDVSGGAGSSLDIPISVRGFDAITGFQFSMHIPTNIATINSVGGFNLNDLDNADFSLSSASSGTITTIWDAPDANNGETLTDDVIIFNINVTLASSPGDCGLATIDGTPTPLEVVKGIQPVNVMVQSGDVCILNHYSISGQIKTDAGTAMQNVATAVEENGNSLNLLTDNAGDYEYSTAIPNATYTFTPSKNTALLNGVSVADVVVIKRHILEITPFNNPYKIIAADVNGNNAVSIFDVSIIRAAILGDLSAFPAGNSWRFVRADQIFSDDNNPFPFDESRTYNNLNQDHSNQDFIGVKLGDVNNTANPN